MRKIETTHFKNKCNGIFNNLIFEFYLVISKDREFAHHNRMQ